MRTRRLLIGLAMSGIILLASGQGCPNVTTTGPFFPGIGVDDGFVEPLLFEISINDLFFDPPDISILAGDTVRWYNDESFYVLHTVTSGLPGDFNVGVDFDSGVLEPGDFFEVTFLEPGLYDYYCTIHPFMQGSVLVE